MTQLGQQTGPNRTFWAVLIVIAIAAYVLASGAASTHQLYDDNRESMVNAYNIVNHGVFSSDTGPSPRPGYHRDVGYAALIAAVFWMPISTVTSDCLTAGDECKELRKSIAIASAVILAALVLVVGFSVRYLSGSNMAGWVTAAIVGLSRWFEFSSASPEALAGLLVACHSLGLALVFRSKSHRTRLLGGLIAGFGLGWLVLTKAVFLYWLALVLVTAIVFAWRYRSVRLYAACVVLPALLLGGGWATRNAYHFGDFATAGRDGEILEIRASFLDMTWPEYFAGFVYALPQQLGPLKDAALKALPESTYVRFRRSNEDGFYRVGKRGASGHYKDQAERDSELTQIAKAKILAHPVEYAAQSVLFAWGLAFPQTWAFPTSSNLLPIVTITATVIANIVALFIGFSLLGVTLAGVARRRWDIVAFCMPSIFSWAFYAAFSHGIPRYAAPIAPIMVACFVLATTHVLGARRARRSGLRSVDSEAMTTSAV